jgi:hypothetical protein
VADRKISQLSTANAQQLHSGALLPVVDLLTVDPVEQNLKATLAQVGGVTSKLAANGTQGAPGVAFASDSNTGLYRPTEDQLAVATGGIDRVLVQSTAPFLRVNSGGLWREVWHEANLPYVEDTYVPVYSPATGAFGAVTYAVQIGTYVRIGSLVNVFIHMQTTSITVGTASGAVRVSLPIVAAATGRHTGFATYRANWVTTMPSGVRVEPATSLALLEAHPAVGTNTSSVLVTNMGTGAAANQLMVSFSYRV